MVINIQQIVPYRSDLDFLSLHFLSLSKPPLILTLNLIQWHTYNIKKKKEKKEMHLIIVIFVLKEREKKRKNGHPTPHCS